MEVIPKKDLLLKTPFTKLIFGQSGVGKTRYTIELLKRIDQMLDRKPATIIYCYGIYNDAVVEIEKMGYKTISGFPDNAIIENAQKPALLILDDLLIDSKEEDLANLYIRGSHHNDCSVIMLIQHLFDAKMKKVRNNTMYFTLLASKSAHLQVRNLGLQLFGGGKLKYFLDAYEKSIKERYGSLFIDLHPSSNPALALRSHIFPEQTTVVYQPV